MQQRPDAPSTRSETQQSRRGLSTIVSGAWGTGSIEGEGGSRTGASRRGDRAGSGTTATAGTGGVPVRVSRPGIPKKNRSVAPAPQTSTPPSTGPATRR